MWPWICRSNNKNGISNRLQLPSKKSLLTTISFLNVTLSLSVFPLPEVLRWHLQEALSDLVGPVCLANRLSSFRAWMKSAAMLWPALWRGQHDSELRVTCNRHPLRELSVYVTYMVLKIRCRYCWCVHRHSSSL